MAMIYSLGWPSLHPVAAQGSPIDELSERSYPNHFAENLKGGKVFHERRELLKTVMQEVGFKQHPQEWWHFSYGDQMWAYFCGLEGSQEECHALYGRVLG
eukprot:scaffold912_cov422-Prasinococcus_capsulatus_cf.AAC.17